MSNQFFYYLIFDNLIAGDKMNDNKLKDLIISNQDLIYSIIHKFRSKDLEDLFQAGCVGLIKAYKNYNSSMNVKFTSYAYNYILGEVYQYIINNRSIHMSPMNIKLAKSLNKAEEYLTNHLGRNPTAMELCHFLEIDYYKLAELKNMTSVDNLDYFSDIHSIEKINKDDLIDLSDALNSLSDEEKSFINARYFNNYTQQELANYYNTNQVKISREEKKILCKLKAKMY